MDEIDSLEKFTALCCSEFFTTEKSRWIFRGQASSAFRLLPSVARSPHTSSDRARYEKSLFEMFKREARAHPATHCANDWEWLSLAQHHGLPTRLLDWSLNPMVALYFAVESEACRHEDGSMFALHAPKKASSDSLQKGPFRITKSVKFHPNLVSPRIKAQEGLFVACFDIEAPLDHDLRPDWSIRKFVVPQAHKASIRYALYRLGVHASSLFPDVDGLASRLRWQHSVAPLK